MNIDRDPVDSGCGDGLQWWMTARQSVSCIFIGKLVDYNNVNVIEILKDFDDLLNIYIEVENENITIGPQNQKSTTGFIFASGRPNLPQSTKYTRTQQQINVNARHSFLQEKLYKKLTSVFGEETVGMEIFLNGKKIDLVLKINNLFTFYEIKTSNSAKQCIREALGQIFEYTYFDGKKYADEIAQYGILSYVIEDGQVALTEGTKGCIKPAGKDNVFTFESPKHYYYPISEQDMVINSNLTQISFWK